MLIFFANVHVIIKRRQLIFHGIDQFQVLDSPTHTLKNFQGVIKVFRPPHTLVNISCNLPVSVFRPLPHTHILTILGGYKKVFRPPSTHTKNLLGGEV